MMTRDDIIDAIARCECPILLEIPEPQNAVILGNLHPLPDQTAEQSLRFKYNIFDYPSLLPTVINGRHLHPISNKPLIPAERVTVSATLLLDMIMLAVYQAINDNAKRVAKGEEPRYVYPNDEPQKVSNYLNHRPEADLEDARNTLNAFISNPNNPVNLVDWETAQYMKLIHVHQLHPITPLKAGEIFVEGGANIPLAARVKATTGYIADARIVPKRLAERFRNEIMQIYHQAVQDRGVAPMPLLAVVAGNVIESRLKAIATALVDAEILPAEAAERDSYIEGILKTRQEKVLSLPVGKMQTIKVLGKRYIESRRAAIVIRDAVNAVGVRADRVPVYLAKIQVAVDREIEQGNQPNVQGIANQMIAERQNLEQQAFQRVEAAGIENPKQGVFVDTILNRYFELRAEHRNPDFNSLSTKVIATLKNRALIRAEVISAGIYNIDHLVDQGANVGIIDGYVRSIEATYESQVAAKVGLSHAELPNIKALSRRLLVEAYADSLLKNENTGIEPVDRAMTKAEIVRRYLNDKRTQDVINHAAPPIVPIAEVVIFAMRAIEVHPEIFRVEREKYLKAPEANKGVLAHYDAALALGVKGAEPDVKNLGEMVENVHQVRQELARSHCLRRVENAGIHPNLCPGSVALLQRMHRVSIFRSQHETFKIKKSANFFLPSFQRDIADAKLLVEASMINPLSHEGVANEIMLQRLNTLKAYWDNSIPRPVDLRPIANEVIETFLNNFDLTRVADRQIAADRERARRLAEREVEAEAGGKALPHKSSR